MTNHSTYDGRTDGERLAAIETTLHEMNRRLFGNGQPGELDKIRHDLNGFGRRVAKLEKFKFTLLGVASSAGAASTYLAKKLGLFI